MDKELLQKLKREDIIPFIDKYYDDIGREPSIRPDYKHYSLAELKKCLVLFNIKLVKSDK
jgi:hypothetical protein